MELLIFDLDGTLVDSQRDISASANAMRTQMGLEPLTHEEILAFVGHGAPMLVRGVLGKDVSDADAARGLKLFQQYYREHPLDFTVPYPGVIAALERLQAHGIKMGILTNKPEGISGLLLDGLGMSGYFFRVYGGDSFAERKPDPVGIEKMLEETGVSREKAMMVGDSAVDIRTARNARIRAAGVRYGFHPESMEAEPPDVWLEEMSDLVPLVLLTKIDL